MDVATTTVCDEDVAPHTTILGEGHRRFEQSYAQYMHQLRSQRRVMSLFKPPDLDVDPGDFDFPTPIRLVYNEEKPSYKDIEAYRGDKDPELTDADREAQQKLNYLQKKSDYLNYIDGIRDVKQIPFKTERLLMLENFKNYLTDARYYIKFYQKYSHYWAPQATRTIVPYKGMYVPLEKRKEEETYHFGEPVSHFEPLRKLIYQDFHDKVRKGEPPSMDLDGKLPTLAMYYARTTFVPPMSDDEMQRLFYPDRVLEQGEKSYLRQASKLRARQQQKQQQKNQESVQYISEFLDQFQTTYITRKHMLRHMNHPFCSSFKSTSDRYISLTGERFLNDLNRIIYLFGGLRKKRNDAFPQPHDCIILLHSSSMTLAQQTSVEYVLLLTFALICGIPIVTLRVNNEDIKSALTSVSEYCNCGLLCTFDEHVLSVLSQREYRGVSEQLGLKHVLYYGNHEPKPRVESVNGSSCIEDPVSNILRPTVNSPTEQSSNQQSSLWQYLPFDVSSTHFDLYQYKASISSTKGVSDSFLEECKFKVLKRCSEWRRSHNILHPPTMLMQQSNGAMLGVDMQTIEKSIALAKETLSSFLEIAHQSNDNRVAQVLIALPTNHPMFHFWILFCFSQGLSMGFVSVAELNTFHRARRHIQSMNPLIIIADMHTTNSLATWMQSPQWSHAASSTVPTVLNNKNILQDNIHYHGLLDDVQSPSNWIKSSLFKAVRNQIPNTKKEQRHLCIVSVGYNRISPSIINLFMKNNNSNCCLFHAIPSESMFGPVVIYDAVATHANESLLNDQGVNIGQPIPDAHSYDVSITDRYSLPCLTRRGRNQVQLSQYEILESLLAAVFDNEALQKDNTPNLLTLRRIFNDISLPQNCKSSFNQFIEMKRELIFYNQVQRVLREKFEARQHDSELDVTAVSPVEHALFGALLDELHYVTAGDNMSSITYDDVQQFLQLRIDLAIEALKLQIIDFKNRFYDAKRSGHVTIDTRVHIEKPELVKDDDKPFILHDLVVFGNVDSQAMHLLCPLSQLLVLSNGGVLNCGLLEQLYETESMGHVQRAYIRRNSLGPSTEALQLVIQRYDYIQTSQLMLKLPDINHRVRHFYELMLGINAQQTLTSQQQRRSWFSSRSKERGTWCTTFGHNDQSQQFLLPVSSKDIYFTSGASGILDRDLEFDTQAMEVMLDTLFHQSPKVRSRL